MTTPILILLILVASLLGAYTNNFLKTTLSLGRNLAPDNPFLPRGFEDAITPKMQTVRIFVFLALILVILAYGLIFYNWYFAIGFTILTVVLAVIFMNIFPKAGADFYKRKIKRDLLKRQAQYKKAGDVDREKGVNYILARFDKPN